MIKPLLPAYAGEINSGAYSDAASSMKLFLAGEAHDGDLAGETRVDVTWLAPLYDLVSRAVEADHEGHNVSALTEVLAHGPITHRRPTQESTP
ncbi:hypothetical protein ACIBG7_42765 [Nonomuraea sp. NPDC050328]|uniref:hypothetical protein n=1 Tax=Nonomuraea sp. NPDC050328 TaxID=3364361 RepID=UPI00379DA8E6